MYGSMTTIILILLWMYFCMNIMMIGAQINCYFEEKFKWVHQVATENPQERISAAHRERR